MSAIPKQQIVATINKARATLVRVGWCQGAWQVPKVGTGAACAYCLLAALSEAADPYAPPPNGDAESADADNVHIATLRVIEATLPVEWRSVTIDPKEDRGRQLGGLVWNLTHFNDKDGYLIGELERFPSDILAEKVAPIAIRGEAPEPTTLGRPGARVWCSNDEEI